MYSLNKGRRSATFKKEKKKEKMQTTWNHEIFIFAEKKYCHATCFRWNFWKFQGQGQNVFFRFFPFSWVWWKMLHQFQCWQQWKKWCNQIVKAQLYILIIKELLIQIWLLNRVQIIGKRSIITIIQLIFFYKKSTTHPWPTEY